MLGFEAWENELFDRWNGEGHQTEEEFWADAFDELKPDDTYEPMKGDYYTNFYTGGEEYQVRTEESTFYTMYHIYQIVEIGNNVLVHTAYSKEGFEAYRNDMYIANVEYDRNL